MPSQSIRCCPCCRAAAFLALALLGACALLGAQEPTGKRRPVPDKTSQAAAKKLVTEIFADDFKNATDAPAQLKLATLLLQQARDSRKDDLPAAYVLYVDARDLAAAAGDYQLAFQAVDEMTAEFNLSNLDLKARVLAQAAKTLTEKDANRALVDIALRLVGEAVDADNYPAAAQFGEVAEAAAKKSKSVALVTSVRKRNGDVLALQKNFARLQPFIDRLKQEPKDAEANLKLGEYYGLLKGKWDKAIPLLALGSDERLRAQARLDRAAPKQGKAQLAVADGWWELADKYKDPVQRNMLRRAANWYEQAAGNSTGLGRTKALKRIEKITARLEGTPAVIVKTGPLGSLLTLKGHGGEVRGVAFSPDGRQAVSGGKDNSVRLWDLTTGKELKEFRGHTKEVWDVAFHPNGRQVLSASWDATVKLWDTTTGREARTFNHPLDVNAVVVTRDGKWMLTGCDDKNARLWDLTSGQEVKKFGGHEGYVYGVAFAHNGRHIATGGQDMHVRVFDKETGQRVRDIQGQSAPSNYVAFALDDQHVFSCGDNAAHLWNVATGKETRRYETAGSSSPALGMALSPDGRRLLTGHEDKTVRLWDVNTGKQLQRFEGHTDRVNCVAFSLDGSRALSGSGDGTLRLWGLPSR